MSRTPSAPCPQCRAKNFTYRRLCWKCGRTLPTSFVLEGARSYTTAQSVARSTSDSEVVAASVTSAKPEKGNLIKRAEFREVVRGLLERCGIL